MTNVYNNLQYQIGEIQNCGMYFIPSSRLDEIYCEFPKVNGKTCREQGVVQAYNERLKQSIRRIQKIIPTKVNGCWEE